MRLIPLALLVGAVALVLCNPIENRTEAAARQDSLFTQRKVRMNVVNDSETNNATDPARQTGLPIISADHLNRSLANETAGNGTTAAALGAEAASVERRAVSALVVERLDGAQAQNGSQLGDEFPAHNASGNGTAAARVHRESGAQLSLGEDAVTTGRRQRLKRDNATDLPQEAGRPDEQTLRRERRLAEEGGRAELKPEDHTKSNKTGEGHPEKRQAETQHRGHNRHCNQSSDHPRPERQATLVPFSPQDVARRSASPQPAAPLNETAHDCSNRTGDSARAKRGERGDSPLEGDTNAAPDRLAPEELGPRLRSRRSPAVANAITAEAGGEGGGEAAARTEAAPAHAVERFDQGPEAARDATTSKSVQRFARDNRPSEAELEAAVEGASAASDGEQEQAVHKRDRRQGGHNLPAARPARPGQPEPDDLHAAADRAAADHAHPLVDVADRDRPPRCAGRHQILVHDPMRCPVLTCRDFDAHRSEWLRCVYGPMSRLLVLDGAAAPPAAEWPATQRPALHCLCDMGFVRNGAGDCVRRVDCEETKKYW